MSLCAYCLRANVNCPAYPLEPTSCVEFHCAPAYTDRAALLIARGMRESERGSEEDAAHWRVLVGVLNGV